MFNGRPVTLNLVDADVKQVFGVFHDISGLNFVLDPAVGGSVTIVVDNVPWDQALDLILKNNSLDMVLEGNVVRIAPVAKLAQEAAARKALIEAKEFEAAPVSITRTLSYADVKEIEKVVRDAILSPKGRVVPDERTNTLIIRDIPSRIDAIDRLLTTLDAETPQVMIEARIVEVSRDFTRDLGVKWGFTGIADESKGTQTNLDFPYRGSVDWDLNLQRSTAHTLGFSFGNVLNSLTLDITLDALETEGYAKRLSSPKIATLNNEKAEIEQGVRIPIVSTTATEIDVTFVSASLRLMVTPQITAEGTVVLDLEVENNSADLVNVVGIPPINTQRAQTKVLIADGGTTVIGGIYSVNEGESENGVPWLRKIPGLGWLFKSKNVQQRNRELLIFVTPRIIKAS
jgi:type IV pilus assembly protein PilQ